MDAGQVDAREMAWQGLDSRNITVSCLDVPDTFGTMHHHPPAPESLAEGQLKVQEQCTPSIQANALGGTGQTDMKAPAGSDAHHQVHKHSACACCSIM